MLFVIHAVDRVGASQARAGLSASHETFLAGAKGFGVRIEMCGPLVSDDGDHPIGSMLLIEAGGRAAVESFSASDPFRKGKIWERVTIMRYTRLQG